MARYLLSILVVVSGLGWGLDPRLVIAQDADPQATIDALQTQVAELGGDSGPTATPAQPHPAEPTPSPPGQVNIELILDVSGSMAQVLPTGETRMDAAKRVLNEVIAAIPAREGINVGLRIYGHEGDNTEAGQAISCESSELVVPVNGTPKVELSTAIGTLQPTGWTPIARSLDRAGGDFPPDSDNITNAVVLVTDGLETCGGDPAASALGLRQGQGQVVTHVIGFALTPDEQALLEGITTASGGLLLGAADATGLTDALFEVLEELAVVEGIGFIGGNAFPLLPQGEAGQLAVIAIGQYDGNLLPLVVRNNTSDNVIRFSATVAARNAAGQLIASGGDQRISPNLVRVGGVAFGYAYFGGIDLPADATFEIELTATSAADDRFENIRDLEVVEASPIEGRVVGFVRNTYDEVIGGPIAANLACFDEAGNLLTHDRAYLSQDSVDPGQDTSFQAPTIGSRYCPYFLVASSGFDQSFGSGRASEVLTPTAEATSEPTSGASVIATPSPATEGQSGDPTVVPAATAASAVAGCPDMSSAEQIVLALRDRGLPVGEYEVYSAETDPNELLGRPGGYIAKATFQDTSLESIPGELGVNAGGSVEVFESEDRVQARADYIRTLYESSPIFTEYDLQQGSTLLRLSKRLTPDQVTTYEAAAREVADCANT